MRLVFAVAGGMRSRGAGHILITGSVASLMPATFRAVHDVSKTFLDSFAVALGNELKDSGVTVSSQIPAAMEMDPSQQAAAAVARVGFEACGISGDSGHPARFPVAAKVAYGPRLPR